MTADRIGWTRTATETGARTATRPVDPLPEILTVTDDPTTATSTAITTDWRTTSRPAAWIR